MNNNQLFNILEKLLDELESFASSDYEIYRYPPSLDTLEYCKKVRKQVFTDDPSNPLSFEVVTKTIE